MAEIDTPKVPKTGTYLDELDPSEVDLKFYHATKHLTTEEALQLIFQGDSKLNLKDPELSQKVHGTMEMLANLTCGIDVNRPKN